MGQPIQFRRGNKPNLPNLNNGEPAFVQDEKDLYVGTPTGNQLVGGKSVMDKFNAVNEKLAQTDNKVDSQFINVRYPPEPLTPAVGDGVEDDTLAIQEMLDYLKSNGKGTLFFPSGIYRISRKTESSEFCLDFRDASHLEMKGELGSKIVANIDVASRDINVILFRNCERINVNGLEFDISLTGEPVSRTNSRILWASGSDGTASIIKNVNISNNIFKIKHATGSSSTKSVYGVLVAGGTEYKTSNIWINRNEFNGISGRNLEIVSSNHVKITENIFEDIGEIYNGVGVRLVSGNNDVTISNNTISTKKNSEGSVSLIQIQGGQNSSENKDVKVHGNTLIINSDKNSQTGINIYGGKNVSIMSNMLEVAYSENSSVRLSNGVEISPLEGALNGNIRIVGNEFRGFTNYCIINRDPDLVNSYVDGNQFYRTFFGVSGRDISDSSNVLHVSENYNAMRNAYVMGKNRRLITYGTEPPTDKAYAYFIGDTLINESPSVGSYEKWICVTSGNPGTWKGVGLIEA